MKSRGPDDHSLGWKGLHESSSSLPCASLPPHRFNVPQRPFSHSLRTTASAWCIDDNPRLAACMTWDCLPALRAHIVFPRPERYTRERTYCHGRRVLSHRRGLNSWGPTYDSSQPRHTLAQSRSSFHTSSSVVMRACTHTHPTLARHAPRRSSAVPPPVPLRARLAALIVPLHTIPADRLQRIKRHHDGSAQSGPRLGSRYTSAMACVTLYDVHPLYTVPLCSPASPRTTSRARITGRCRSLPPTPPPSPARAPSFFSALYLPHRVKNLPCFAAPLHHPLGLQRPPWPFLIAHATFIASSRAKRVSNKQDSTRYARASAHLQHDTPPTCSAHGAAAPHRLQRLDHLPLSPAPHRPPLEASSCLAPGVISPPCAPRPSSALTPTLARNFDLPCTANVMWEIAPPCIWISAPASSVAPGANESGLVHGGEGGGEEGNLRDGQQGLSVSRFAYGVGYVHLHMDQH
ncbi:hypothetical protein MVEN_00033300 [Mycena venus]|uniref:Uncharacterized protein n=1 Tax=Mycena venus TaxID=2733690 RepID=A0A8H6Z6Q8_9AGAR|nr:hypothetical protein MVEN_00033300 [Mycena venus]